MWLASMFCTLSKVFLSDWGRLFSRIGVLPAGHLLDLPNAAFGLIYFTIVLLHPYLPLGNYKVSTASLKCRLVIYRTAYSSINLQEHTVQV
jgi:hypothetical protein